MALYTAYLNSDALTAAATETRMQLATPAGARAKLVEFSISFDGSTAAAPVRVELLRQLTAGTGGASFTPLKLDPADGAPVVTALTAATNWTAEPTPGDILFGWQVAANNGLLVMQYPLGREPVMPVSTRLALRTITPTGVNPNSTCYMLWEES